MKYLLLIALAFSLQADYLDVWLLTDNEKRIPILKDDYRIDAENPTGFEPDDAMYEEMEDTDEQAYEEQY